MATKGKEVQVDNTVILGKVGNNLQIGVVGLPNVGKSSLFNILTNMSIPAENFPFCTIDPNVSRCAVPDDRYDWLCSVHNPKSRVPAYLSITDIAGLVKGASEGAGLGNAFLSHIQAVDGIFHMIRAFDNPEIIHVEDTVDPVRDLQIISGELLAKDIDFTQKALDTLTKSLRGKPQTKAQQLEIDTYQKVIDLLKSGKHARFGVYTNAEVEFVRELRLLTAKPALYLVNLSQDDYIKKKNKFLPKIKQWIDENGGGPLIPVSVAFESHYASLQTPEEKKKFETESGATTNLPKIIKQGYHHLQLCHYFTCGPDEVRCWTFQKGYKAPQCAGIIHTDFENNFIMAEVMSYEDFAKYKSESECKAAGRYRQEGKNYLVADGDIIFFKFGTGGAKKK
ncbi:GTP-binding protein [Tieghemostelium lacteum]|uniref:Obg-like ATPase 1 n=1 Tax=Tieghemostelium lacteum TaxID=361077 RepID=A0A151Z5J7_TIELA|nr:GTP-binding protein [Tieghemostelium lacteum]|eukprot:KYQ89197.1 GTP-binding protein [Tieghemostelium lacteum]